jgi:glyoxylase-like metal-dependent hydrolase (beta-lactamase superfamily II)
MVMHFIEPRLNYDSNVFLITGDENILVDAGTGFDAGYHIASIREIVGDGGIQKLILTHCHIDHVGGIPAMVREFGCTCYCGPEDALSMRTGDQEAIVSALYNTSFPATEVLDLADGEIIDIGAHRLRILHTPGHTAGGICIYDEVTKGLISGDTVFAPGIGRTDLPGGSFDKIAKSIARISKLDITGLYPGHGDISRQYGADFVRGALRTVGI